MCPQQRPSVMRCAALLLNCIHQADQQTLPYDANAPPPTASEALPAPPL
jgi:hypothetical protein